MNFRGNLWQEFRELHDGHQDVPWHRSFSGLGGIDKFWQSLQSVIFCIKSVDDINDAAILLIIIIMFVVDLHIHLNSRPNCRRWSLTSSLPFLLNGSARDKVMIMMMIAMMTTRVMMIERTWLLQRLLSAALPSQPWSWPPGKPDKNKHLPKLKEKIDKRQQVII